jgi:hypothetical protein
VRVPIALLVAVVSAPVRAACPPDCVAGGGPAATDCFIAFDGILSTTVTCTDGDACDTDGKRDGVCTLGLQACINVPGLGSCQPGGLLGAPAVKPAKDLTGQQLAAALSTLDLGSAGCTPPGLRLPVKISLAGIKTGKSRLTVTAVSGGKRDRDKLKLACQPSTIPPSLAQDVQPIFTEKCAYAGCHDSFFKAGGQDLSRGVSYGSSVGARSTLGKLPRVTPGSLKRSQMAHRLLGVGIPVGGTQMPQGCPGLPPMHGCLTPDETFTILSWIANGAPNN